MYFCLGGVGGRLGLGRPVGIEAGGLIGKYRSVCLSVCVGKEQRCRFLGLCVVPRRGRTSGGEGTRALGLTGTVGTRGVLRVCGRTCKFGRDELSGVGLANCVGLVTRRDIGGEMQGDTVRTIMYRLRECAPGKVLLEGISGACLLNFVSCLGGAGRRRYGGRGALRIGARFCCLGALQCYLGETMSRSCVAIGPVGGVGGRSGPGHGQARESCLAVGRLAELIRAPFCGVLLEGTFLFDYFYKLERYSVVTLE